MWTLSLSHRSIQSCKFPSVVYPLLEFKNVIAFFTVFSLFSAFFVFKFYILKNGWAQYRAAINCLFVTIIAYSRGFSWEKEHLHSRTHVSMVYKLLQPPALLTSKVDGISTMFEFNTLQCFAQGFMVMAYGLFLTATEWQWKICICFLPIVVRAHRIHPQYDFFLWCILKLRGHINKYMHHCAIPFCHR